MKKRIRKSRRTKKRKSSLFSWIPRYKFHSIFGLSLLVISIAIVIILSRQKTVVRVQANSCTSNGSYSECENSGSYCNRYARCAVNTQAKVSYTCVGGNQQYSVGGCTCSTTACGNTSSSGKTVVGNANGNTTAPNTNNQNNYGGGVSKNNACAGVTATCVYSQKINGITQCFKGTGGPSGLNTAGCKYSSCVGVIQVSCQNGSQVINSGSNNTQIQINQTGTTTPQQNAANLCPNTGDGITGTGNSNCAPAGRTYRDSNGTPLIFGSSQAELACQQAYNGDTCYARNSSVDVWHCSCQSPNSTSNRNIICTDKYGNKGPVTGPNNTGSACSPSQVCSGTITLTNLNITAPGWNQICHANSSQQSNTSSNIGKPCGCTPGANNDNCNGFGQPTSSNGTCKSGQNGIPNGCYENENQCGTWGPVGVLQQNVCCFPSAQASVKVNLSNGNANPTANTITSLLSVATHVGRSAQVPLASNGQGVLGASMTTIPLTSAYNPETGQYESQSLNFSTIPDGSYDFLLHVDGYLNARLQPTDGTGYFIIKNGQLTQSIEPIQLTPGDILPLPHGDNIIDQQDYDMIVKCINKDPACTPQIKQIADLDKDGDVDNTELQLVQKALGESGDTFPTPPPCPTGQSLTGLGCIPNNPIGFTAKLFVIGLSLIGGIATLFIIYGGYLILFSQGNSSQIQRGKRYLTSAITGLLFFILAASFFEFVTLNILHLPGIGK